MIVVDRKKHTPSISYAGYQTIRRAKRKNTVYAIVSVVPSPIIAITWGGMRGARAMTKPMTRCLKCEKRWQITRVKYSV